MIATGPAVVDDGEAAVAAQLPGVPRTGRASPRAEAAPVTRRPARRDGPSRHVDGVDVLGPVCGTPRAARARTRRAAFRRGALRDRRGRRPAGRRASSGASVSANAGVPGSRESSRRAAASASRRRAPIVRAWASARSNSSPPSPRPRRSARTMTPASARVWRHRRTAVSCAPAVATTSPPSTARPTAAAATRAAALARRWRKPCSDHSWCGLGVAEQPDDAADVLVPELPDLHGATIDWRRDGRDRDDRQRAASAATWRTRTPRGSRAGSRSSGWPCA